MVRVEALTQAAKVFHHTRQIERAEILLPLRPPGLFLAGASALLRFRSGKTKPAAEVVPTHFRDVARHLPGIRVAAFVDRWRQHQVEPVQIEFGAHLVVDLAGRGLLRLHHVLRDVAADECQMRPAAGAFAGDCGEFRLGCQPCHHRGTGVRLAVEIDMDEGRTNDAADVVGGPVGEILGQKVRGDFRCVVAAPAFEDRLLAALLWFPTVGCKQRVDRPAERARVKLDGG